MYLSSNEIVKCPHCGKENSIVIHQILDPEERPDLKEKLINGTLFEYECEHCHNINGVDYGMIYQDLNNAIMIHYTKDRVELSYAHEMVEKGRKENPQANHAMIRFVSTTNALREKVRIFDQQLDDKVIELMKVATMEIVAEEVVNHNVEEILCWVEDSGNFEFTFLDQEDPLVIQVDKDAYDATLMHFMPFLLAYDVEPVNVDLEWANELVAQLEDENDE